MAVGWTEPSAPLEPAGVDAVGRQQDVAGHRHVGRREPQLAAPLVALGHHAPHLVRPAEQRVGQGEVALDQGVADAGRRHSLGVAGGPPVGVDQVERRRPRSRARRPCSRSRATLPDRLWPKWKSSPTTTTRAAEAADQHLAHEVLGRLAAAGLVEGDHEAVVDAGGGQQLELLVEVGEQAGRRLGPHHRRGMAVEGDHRGGQAPLVGPPPHLGDDRAVARGARRRRRRW